MSKGAAAAIVVIPAGLCGLLAAVLCLPVAAGNRSPAGLGAAKLASIAAGIGTLLAVTGWGTVAANSGARSWHAASRLGLPLIAAGVVLGILVLLGMAGLTQVRGRASADAAQPAAPRCGPSPAGCWAPASAGRGPAGPG